MSEDPLSLDPERMRELGHRTVDLLVDMLGDPATPALRRASPAEMRERIPAAASAGGRDFEELLAQLREDVFPYMSRLDHPGYFAFIPACGTWPSALGDFLASALNIYAGSWMEAAGPSRLELVVLEWFRDWIGYPSSAAGLLVSGGSAANMTALACAREARLGPMSDDAVAYLCDQAHSSLARAARLLGFRSDQVRVLPADERGRLRPRSLARAIEADARAGRRPLFAAAAAGSTNTGAVDPLAELAAVARERGVWLHVDAAYGGFAALTDRGREALRGIELADSVTLDPHKWLYQPFECGSLLVRDGSLLRRAFEITPDYLHDAVVEREEVNFSDLGLQLSRGTRALKVWLSIEHFGVDAFRATIDRCLDLAAHAQRHVKSRPELELMSPASLGIICFRRRTPGGDEDQAARVNAALVAGFEATGTGLVSSTKLRGIYAVRLCVMNHTSTAADVERVLDWFAEAPLPASPGRVEAAARDSTVAEGWYGGADIAPGVLGSAPLFAGLDAGQLELVSSWARDVRVSPGEAVIRQFDASRDLYVILDGSARVNLDGRDIDELRAGDFFGELGALDWGAGYGYGRSATIVASSPLRLLALSPAHVSRLMTESPAVAARLEAARRAHLQRT